MLIKYFYQVGHQFQFDQKNGMVIPEIKQVYFTRNDIFQLLEKDKVEVNKLESLKYWNKVHEGWVEISEKTLIDMRDNKDKELLLLLKVGEDITTMNSEVQIKFNSLIKSLQYQEQRIKELESRLKGMSSFNLHHLNSTHSLTVGLEGGNDIVRNPSNINIHSIYANEDSRLDISFLYSNPLVKEAKDKPIPLNEPIDFESEINCLVDIFQDSGKKISSRFEVANLDNISEIIRKKPKILHISCHGAYEEIDGENKFYLYFEDNKGRLDKFDLEKLNNLLKSSVDEKSQIEIVFVSACHSEAVANVFKEAKVPAVICVHSATKVLDEAAQKFAKIFYNALLDGKSLAYSFEQAKRVVSAGIDQNARIPHCCCSHTHKSECRWYEKSIKDYDEAHQYHLKQCKCNYKESHMHMRNCPWAINLLSDEIFESITVGCNYIKICCCSPEAAHDESNKFLLKSDPDFIKESPFSALPPGNFEVKNKNCCLNINFSVEMKTSLIGRNVELYNVISIFSAQNLNKNRLVTVFGGEGVGKNSFAKLAGKYMFERKFFQDGVIYVNTRGHIMTDMWFISKVISNLELDTPIDDIFQFCNLIRQLRILVIINFSRQHEETLRDIRKMMKTILDHTRNPKFLITLEKPLDLDLYENKILLEPLDEYFSAKLLITLAGEHLPKILRNDLMHLAKHDIIKISQGIPGKIHQIAGLLQEHKKLEVLIEKIKKENMKKQTLSDELVKILLDNMSKNSSLIYEILYVLSILPQGILDIEITTIYKNNYKEVIEILDYIASNTIIISKSTNKDLKQTVYLLADDLVSSVEALSIEESVKLKCYRDLVIYYGTLMRHIVNSLYIDNESATEFSAAQNQGMWLSITLGMKPYKPEKIFQPAKRYAFDETNILSIIKVDNRFLRELIHKKDLEFIESIEQLSICMPTVLKINKKMTECITSYNLFFKICEEYQLRIAQGRLYLFKASLYSLYFTSQLANSHFFPTRNSIYSDSSSSGMIFSNLIQAKKLFEIKKFEEGDAEASFVKAVIMYEIEVNRNRYSHERISKEAFEDIVKELDRAIKIYRRIQNQMGLARASFIMAEYSVYNKHFEESVLNHYKEALHFFEKDNKKILQIKSLQGISKWYMGIKNYVMSKDFVEQAKMIAEKMKGGKNSNELIIYEIEKQINEILDQSRVQSHNVFVFIKAHQLVKMHINSDFFLIRSKSVDRCLSSTNKDIEYTIDPVINHYSTFKDRLYEKFNKFKKELIVKFDFLTEGNLKDILGRVGRVLHISSDDYNDRGSLFVEGSDGESLELTPDRLQEILTHSSCVYDLVILAIPQAEHLAKIFVEAGIPHVICFSFVEDFIKQSESLPLISLYNTVHEFTIAMLNSIILEQTVEDAYKNALREFNTQIANIRQHLFDFNMQKDYLEDKEKPLASVLLLPEGNNHRVKLYGRCLNSNNEETVLFEGKILDLSKVRARLHNIRKRNHAIIGRKREIYHSVKMIKVFNFYNIYGEPGCGKTLLAKEICYYLYVRNYFRDGIFYFDINDVRNVEKIKALFHEADVYAAIEEMKKAKVDSKDYEDRKILILFDNADKIVKYNDNQFFLFLKSLIKDRDFIHYFIVSNKEIINECVTETMEVPPFSPHEALYFYLYFVKRNMEKGEIDIDPHELTEGYHSLMERINNMCDLVSVSARFKACKGMPKYLKKLAELSANKALKSVDWKELNLPRKMIKTPDNSNYNSNQKKEILPSLPSCKSLIHESSSKKDRNSIGRCQTTNFKQNSFILNSNNKNVELENLIVNNKGQLNSSAMVNPSMQLNQDDNYFECGLNCNNNFNDLLQASINLQTGQGCAVNGLQNKSQVDQSVNLLSSITSSQLNFNSNNTAAPNITKRNSFKLNVSGISNISSGTASNYQNNANPFGGSSRFTNVNAGSNNNQNANFVSNALNANFGSLNSSLNIDDVNISKTTINNNELKKSISSNVSQNPNIQRENYNTNAISKTRINRKKQSEILEVDEDEREQIFSDGNEETSQISYILRPSNNENIEENSFSEEEGDNEVDTFIYNQAFSPDFKAKKLEMDRLTMSQNAINTHPLNTQYFNAPNCFNNSNAHSNNQTFSMDFFNQQEMSHQNSNVGNIIKNSLNPNDFNLPSSRTSKRESQRNSNNHGGQPIIIQNFFNNNRPFDDSREGSNKGNSVNMSINIRSRGNKILEERNPFPSGDVKSNTISTPRDRLPFGRESLNNCIISQGELEDSLTPEESEHRSTISYFTQSNSLSTGENRSSLKRSDSNFAKTPNPNNKKKKKKGMKSGKMYDKFKQKSNNKYVPNQKKKKSGKEDNE